MREHHNSYDGGVTDIEIGAFNGSGSVVELYIRSSHLKSLKRGQLDGLDNVEIINFRAPIEYIEPRTFEKLTNLKKIIFERAPLSQTTKGAFAGKFSQPLTIDGLPADFGSDELNVDSL